MATTKKTFIGFATGEGEVSTFGATGDNQVVNTGSTFNPDAGWIVTIINGERYLVSASQSSKPKLVGGESSGAAFQNDSPCYVWDSFTAFGAG
jgi:hypothetical protein